MSNAELDALIKAAYKAKEIAPGLLARLDSACVWQLQQRSGYHYELQPPETTIPPEEGVVSIVAAIALRVSFAHTIRPPWTRLALCIGSRQSIPLNVRSFAIECRLTGGSTGCIGSNCDLRRPNRSRSELKVADRPILLKNPMLE